MNRLLISLRKKTGLTKSGFATKVGVSYETLNELENGALPLRLKTLRNWARMFKFDIKIVIIDKL